MANGPLHPGDVVAGKYLLEHVLGQGGMGTVYAAVHCMTGKRLALKCLLPEYAQQPVGVERFMREARAAGSIHHRHVIDVFDVGQADGALYLVMPRLEGVPLSQLLHDGELAVSELIVILVRAMEGVAAAHAQGIIHRDLKPGNLFVCVGISGKLDDPRVLDFGISKLTSENHASLTRSSSSMGTPAYMAIEQLTGRSDLDQRVDVYAMGVILYEALGGRLPFRAANIAALALQIMQAPPQHLGAIRPDLPAALTAIVMRALAREREERFASMRAFIDALQPFTSAVVGGADQRAMQMPLRCSKRPETRESVVDGCAPTEPLGSGRPVLSASVTSTPGLALGQSSGTTRRRLLGLGLLVLPFVASPVMMDERARDARLEDAGESPSPSFANAPEVRAVVSVSPSPAEVPPSTDAGAEASSSKDVPAAPALRRLAVRPRLRASAARRRELDALASGVHDAGPPLVDTADATGAGALREDEL